MRLLSLALAVLIFAPACQPAPNTIQPSALITITSAATPPPVEEASFVDFTRDGLTVSLPKPAGWESVRTNYGVVISERFGTVADAGKLRGLTAYVFVMPLSEFPPMDASSANNPAEHVLTHIVNDKEFIGTSHVSHATGFNWDGHAAAYYLMTDPDSNLKTLVIGVTIPDSDSLVVSTLSAPLDQSDSIRPALYDLFGTLTVNGGGMDTSGLDTLPDPLIFP